MAVDHLRELLVRLQSLPLQRLAPVLEKAPCPALPPVVPQLAELLLEEVGRVQPPVGLEQQPQTPSAVRLQVFRMRQQCVLLTLDEAPVLARQAGALGLAHRVQRLAEMAQHMELVEQDGCLRRVLRLQGRVAERLPHVHHRQPDSLASRRAQQLVELVHARLGAVFAAKPDRPPLLQVADHDSVSVPLADRDLVDADHLRRWLARSAQLLAHVFLLESLDRLPAQPRLLGHVRDRHGPAASPHEEDETLSVERIIRQPLQGFLLHRAARLAIDAANLQRQVDPRVPAGQVADSAYLPVVPASLAVATGAAGRFFPRRWRRTMRAFGSPKRPCTVGVGRKPGKR